MLILLVACVASPEAEAPPDAAPSQPTVRPEDSFRGCTSEIVVSAEGLTIGTCQEVYDENGYGSSYHCIDTDGYVSYFEAVTEPAGCQTYELLYMEGDWGSYRDERDFTCDEHGNTITDVGAVEQTYPDGEWYSEDYDWFFRLTYADDLLVDSLRELPDGGDRWHEQFAYEVHGWLERVDSGWEGERATERETLTYDERGNRVYREYDGTWSHYESWQTYDGLDRAITWRSDGESGPNAAVSSYDGDTHRLSTITSDDGDDGTVDTLTTYTWTCP
ncbi:MAG: hypothetical protein Q8P18_15550 [Pseudomonadota bacterium]|nr:hypothetical protein [Pseudomonadota bacterium]